MPTSEKDIKHKKMKRVLIVNGTAIGEKSGTGITLENLWCDYPKKSILQLRVDYSDCQYNTEYETVSTPIEFCQIPNRISRKRRAKAAVRPSATISLNASITQSGVKAILHDGIRGLLDSWPVHFGCINKKIDCFLPQVVYTCGASIRILKTALYYSERYSAPIVLHLMDDWPSTLYTTSKYSAMFRAIMLRYLRKIAKRSLQSFAISNALAEKYAQIFGIEMLPLMNPASDIASSVNVRKSEAVKFVYAGSLSLNRWKSLLDIARILLAERKQGVPNRFNLYIPVNALTKEMQEAFEKNGATLHPYVQHAELLKIYRESDVMVFAESFDENVARFTRYSLSTKIPEYMGTGNAILAYLPADSHASDYIKARRIGFVANNEAELKTQIHIILTCRDKCYSVANRALEMVIAEHSESSERKKLYESLQKDFSS